jgi:membrane protease YdiL (CAAX protease family)
LKRYDLSLFSKSAIIIPVYVALIIGVELMGAFVAIVPGTIGQALLILTLLGHSVLQEKASYRRALPVLSLIPLLRLLSLTMPIKQVPQIYWYVLIGVPLLLAVFLTVRFLEIPWTTFGLRPFTWPPQIMIGLHGFPLSLIAYLLVQPKPLVANDQFELIIAAVILVIFSGFTEEIIFRGLVQEITSEIFGNSGIFYSSLLFAVVYIGSLSLQYLLFIGLVGLFLGWCVKRTGSIWGVVMAHSLLNIGMLLLWPILWPVISN